MFYEKTHTWKFLKSFYENPKLYALVFQLKILFSFADAHAYNGLCLTERSTTSGFFVFARMLYMDDYLEHDPFVFIQHVWEEYNQTPDMIVYLETPIDVCLARIQSRKRPGEQEISREYLEKIEQAHEFYLTSVSNVSKKA